MSSYLHFPAARQRAKATSFLLSKVLFGVLFLALLLVSGEGWGQTIGEFRSRQSGNWNDANTWEQWDGANWVTERQSIMPLTPIVEATTTGAASSADVDSHPITLPSGIVAGNLLVVVFSVDQAPNITINTIVSGNNWIELGQSSRGNIVTGAVFWKIAQGGGGDALTLTTSNVQRSSHITYRISNAVSVSGSSATGNGVNSDPPNHLPADGAWNYLWIATRSGDAEVTATDAPLDFSSLLTIAGGDPGGASTNSAIRTLTGTSLDPSSFTSADERWVSFTLAILGGNNSSNAPINYPQSVFSSVVSSRSSAEINRTNSHAIALPLGISAGDMLLIFWTDENVSTSITTTGWTELYSDLLVNRRCSAYYRVADGNEGASATFTTSGNERSAHNSYRIAAGTYYGSPVAGAAATGNSTMPDPPNLNTGWGVKNTLWIAASHSAGHNNVITNPSNYDNQLRGHSEGNSDNHATMVTARREFVAILEDPANFTLTNAKDWAANTIAIRGTGTATVLNGKTVNVTTNVSVPDVTVELGGTVSLDDGITLTIPADGTFAVNGTLHTGADGTATMAGAGVFLLNSGATLGITSTEGITTAGAFGNIQTTTRNFNAAANYLYNGSAAQDTGDGLPAILTGDLEIDNPAGVSLSVAQTINMPGALLLTDGNLITTTNLLTLGDGATVMPDGGSETSFVHGPVQKIGDDDFAFPVGKNDTHAPIQISALGALTDAYQAEYFDTAPTGDLDMVEILAISPQEYWDLDKISGASANVSLNFTGVSMPGMDDLDNLRVARFNETMMEWEAAGMSVTPSGSATTGGTITANTVTNFSFFTLGSSEPMNALPIELLAFTATPKGETVQLDWRTATELNNAFFHIERSTDGRDFKEIGKIAGAGTSHTPLDYAFTDQLPQTGWNYYRLRQVDFDGQFSYSPVQAVLMGKDGTIRLQLFPNPANNALNLKTDRLIEPADRLEIYDYTGRQVMSCSASDAVSAPMDISQLPAGTYVVRLRTAEGLTTAAFLKQ